ncbi:hypothetical protein I79_007133 [Cricetulus griseus]|uniref:Uncharacterized protein n=1 Tax=Cricetulus griseus TaxID=10029 RepID=G3H9Q3_CRIGR|nr:hypothetical protein I79_007133 [Cricetulus griseus]
MWWKGRYSTHTQFCYLVLEKTKGKGKGQDTESVPLMAPGTESTTPGVYTVMEEASPVPTWHIET